MRIAMQGLYFWYSHYILNSAIAYADNCFNPLPAKYNYSRF